MYRNFTLLFVLLLFFSCNKGPGEGGTSSISGKIYRYEVNALGQVLDEYYPTGKDVFIIYGDEDDTYDDKFDTSLDGSFEFKNLTKGTYRIFTYSRCDTCAGGDEAIITTVEITENKQHIDLGDIITYK